MTRFSTAVSRALDPQNAAEQLAALIDQELGASNPIAGGLILATEAAGEGIHDVGRSLARRWPGASLFGTSFEGILADGRIFRDEPAYAVLAWPEGPFEPIPLVLEPGEQDAARIARDILDAAGRSELIAGDLVLLFPDALGSPQLERVLSELRPLLGPASLAGAAATGVNGHPAQAFVDDEARPGALLGLFVPGTRESAAFPVRCAGGSRSASPWLEITECRARWVDGLDGEPPLEWVRRQLGLERNSPVEPHLDRLLVRVRRRAWVEGVAAEAEGATYEERYVIGVDDRRGSFSLPGTFRRGDSLALALPDAGRARETLRASIDELAGAPLLLQFACRARDETLHGDPDLESAWVAHHAPDRQILGTVSPFQLAMNNGDAPRILVHSTVLTALGVRRE
jgi:small ligand-binding sensory domain FIST